MPILPLVLICVNRFAARIGYCAGMTDSVARLYEAVIAVRGSDPAKSRTARLLRAGRAKMAKKLAEEAVEVVIDAMHGQPEAVVRESADLLYNLVVLVGPRRGPARRRLGRNAPARADVRHCRKTAKESGTVHAAA